MNRCIYCEAGLGVFEAFCSPTCRGLWALQVESVPPCCDQGTLELAGFTRAGVSVLRCAPCNVAYTEGDADKEIVVKAGDVPSLAQKLGAMRLQGELTRGVA